MRSEALLEAIGEIKDEYIVEATPEKVVKKPNRSWMKYAALAACFCLCMLVILQLGTGIFSVGKSEAPAMEEAAMEDAMIEEDAAIEESVVEEEAVAEEEAPAEGVPNDEAPALEEAPAEDTPAEDLDEAGSIREDIHDVAYGVVIDGVMYFPISFQERKDYDLISEDATGLTPENKYQITEADLGEVIGVVEDCPGNPDFIGCTVYSFTKFPDDKNICIVDVHGSYEFYVAE